MSGADRITLIDTTIMSVVRQQWLKVAMIIGKAEEILERRGFSADLALTEQEQAKARDEFDAITERIWALVEAGKLEGAGNLSNWRHSEVRLPRNAK